MNATPKRSHHKKKPLIASGEMLTKPKLPHLDPFEAAQEACRLAQEGNLKLSKALDTLRQTLETITQAEFDHDTQSPVTAKDLRVMAVAGLDAYSRLVGQSWRRTKLSGATRAGDRSMARLGDEGYADNG